MSFLLPELGFGYADLEPHIDARTMEIHYSKHHNGYTNNLNNALGKANIFNQTIEEILTGLDMNNMAVRNFNDGEKQKLIQIISQGSQVLGEVDDLKSGLRDTVKSIAEELELKPALINKAISIAHKGNYQNLSDDMDTLDSILTAAGKI